MSSWCDFLTRKGSILVLWIYHHQPLFPLRKERMVFACSQSSGRSINHLIKHHWFSSVAYSSCQSSHLTVLLMVLARRIALTNSVYLQAHQSTLQTRCQPVRFRTKTAPHPKISTAGHRKTCKDPDRTLAHADLEWYPSTDQFLQHESQKLGFFSVTGEQGLHWKQLARSRFFEYMCILSITIPNAKNETAGGTWGTNVM